MKKTLFVWLAAGLLFYTAGAFAADISAQTGISYQNWSSDENESGSQLYVPVRMQGDHQRWSWEVTTGYASTSGDLDSDSEQSVSGLLDTQAGVTYLLTGWGGIECLAGLDLNLPTGQTGLDEREVRIMIDPDLVSIVSPGQGFNVNPTLSAARQWEQWTFGLGLGYAFQGTYDYSKQTREYDPGDIFNAAAQVDYAFADVWKLSLNTQYLTMGMDRAEDEDILQKGDTWLIGTALQRADDVWDMGLSVQWIFRGKAKVKDPNGTLVTESRDSQGDEWLVDLSGQYHWRPRTSFTAGLQYLYLAENGYERSSAYYMGDRRKYSFSLGWLQQFSETLDLQCTLGGFTMDDDPNWLHPGDDRSYQGWSVTAGITNRF
jgi:hypothetical protein